MLHSSRLKIPEAEHGKPCNAERLRETEGCRSYRLRYPLTDLKRRLQFFCGCILSVLFFSFVMLACSFASASDLPNHWVMFADTHIPGEWDKTQGKDFHPNQQFAQARQEILALADKPAGVMIVGDLVYLHGLEDDYKTLAMQLAPFDEAKMPVYLLPGNHDNEENFAKQLERYGVKNSPVEGKQVRILETPNANWFLLDSLEKTNSTPGLLGEKQLAWLAKELDKRPDKPAILVAHHNLEAHEGSLADQAELWQVVAPRKQVKAYIYGHTHQYRDEVRDGVFLINLPAMGWRFDEKQPLGWTDVETLPDGIKLTLHTLDKAHPKNGDTRTFHWNSRDGK